MGVNGHRLSAGVRWCVGSDPEIGRWTARRLGTVFTEESATAIGLRRGSQIVAGVIYENWNGASIMAHIAVEGRLNKAFLFAIFHYPFLVCDVRKIICPVAEANARSRRLAEHMGFVAEARLADCDPAGDVLLYTLARTNCRFLGGRYG